MENASKALLIAGSVLVVILLIAMGVRVLNSTQGTTDATQTTMQATEIAMFNNKFTQYTGDNKKYAQVKSLLDLISASNSTSDRKITVFAGPISGTATGYMLPNNYGSIQLELEDKTNYSFSIFVGNASYDSDGFIKNIYIRYYK